MFGKEELLILFFFCVQSVMLDLAVEIASFQADKIGGLGYIAFRLLKLPGEELLFKLSFCRSVGI